MSGPLIIALFLGCVFTSMGASAGDAQAGEAVYRASCETCHGAAAEGGGNGKYPRLGGLPREYLASQLLSFIDRTRQNKPMIPVIERGGLGDEEIASVSAFLSGLPRPAVASDPLQERTLLAAVETEEPATADVESGREIYQADCALCHGESGEGKADTPNPPLEAQYARYLAKQIDDFISGARWHEFAGPLFQDRYPEEIQSMLAYLFEIARGPSEDG